MKYKLLLLILLFSATVKAQTTDTVEAKINKLPDLDYEIAPSLPDNKNLTTYIASKLSIPRNGTYTRNDYAIAILHVDSNGSVNNAQILKHFSDEVDKNILNTLNSLPPLNPAYYNGHFVNNTFLMTISFNKALYNTDEINATCSAYQPNFHFDKDNPVFAAVEVEPTFPGGGQAFKDYINNNLIYPVQDKSNGIEGRVILSFVVEKDGTMNKFTILRSPDEAMSIEALRLMHTCPKFNPGIQNGQPVRVQYTSIIPFSLHN